MDFLTELYKRLLATASVPVNAAGLILFVFFLYLFFYYYYIFLFFFLFLSVRVSLLLHTIPPPDVILTRLVFCPYVLPTAADGIRVLVEYVWMVMMFLSSCLFIKVHVIAKLSSNE